MKRVLAIIPARGGSKGITGKNLRLLGGKPLISYPIVESQKSKTISKIVVSTDSKEIGDFAESSGVKVIYRPDSLATDKSPVIDSVIHVLDELEKEGERFDIAVLLQPTSPFWNVEQLENMLGLFGEDEPDGVVSVIPSLEMHPSRMYNQEPGGFLSPLTTQGETVRRQDLNPVYFRNGCFYAVKTSVLRTQKTLMPARKKAFLMDPDWFLTIDTPRDLKLAEVMAAEWNERG